MNPVLLRKQLQENASDLQDFCKDLKSWGEEMKRKEEALKNDNKKMSQKVEDKKPKKTTVRDKKSNRSTPKKSVTKKGITDYAAWDKFDADAECNKLEDDVNEDSELTDECMDNMQDLALLEKEKGNKYVKNQKWNEAIKCYSKAIEYYSYDPIFYANRALCYLKKNNFEEAEKDSTLSLQLDKTYVKAYQRRAAARESLNKLEYAEYDLMKVLELEPKNAESKISLERVKRKLGKTDKAANQRPVSKFTASRSKSNIMNTFTTQPKIEFSETNVANNEFVKVFDTSKPVAPWPDENDIILVRPVNKPPHLRSTKPLKRIKIVEKESREENVSVVEPEPKAIKEQVFEKREKIEPVKDNLEIIQQKFEYVAEKVSENNVSAFKKRQFEKVSEKLVNSNALPKSDQPNNSIRSSDFKIVERRVPNDDVRSVISEESRNISNINKEIDTKLDTGRSITDDEIKNTTQNTNKDNKKIEDETNTEFKKPKTSVQFNLSWKNLKTSEDKYKYLKLVDPQDIPRIFLNSLESSVFSEILEILVKYFIENNEPIFNILEYFTQVKRFGTFTMFMSSSDKKNLWKLFDYIKEFEQINKEDVDRLIRKYEL